MGYEEERRAWIETLRPVHVVWEITLACNMRCIHCGSSASPLTQRKDELSTEEALDAIKQMKELCVQRVVLSGGEPFIRQDWETLAKQVADLDMTPSFISNGFLLNEARVEKLKNINREDLHVGLSVDGNEKMHDYIRQTKGSFKNVTRAMDIMKEKGVKFAAITQVNKLNFKLLPWIRDHIFAHGVYAWQIQLASPWGRLLKMPKLLLTPQEYLKLAEFIAEQRSIMGNAVVGADDIGYYTDLEEKLRPKGEWGGCHAGLKVFGLASNGGVTGCLSLQSPEFIEGNIRQRKLKDIWFDPSLFLYNRDFKEENLQGYCKECIHRLKCRGGCKNIACSFSGSPYDNYYCVYRVRMGKSPKRVVAKVTPGSQHFHP
jgi:radical SAM protein with 4Fe4S-binding SPASM domain